MINLKIIKGIRDYVNQTAASAPVPRSRAPAAYAALRYKRARRRGSLFSVMRRCGQRVWCFDSWTFGLAARSERQIYLFGI